MKRICIIMPGKLPIPNIMGGAIETLMTLLLDENEIEQKAYFIVISAWADGVEDASKKYQYAEFHYIKVKNEFLKKSINFVNYLIAKATGTIDFFSTPFHKEVRELIKNIHVDAVVVEHGVYKHFDFLREFYDRNQLYLHFHGVGPAPDKKTCNTFGHVITVSEFVKKFYEPNFKDNNADFHVCLNGIDEKVFMKRISETERYNARKIFDIREDDFLIVYCGRLIKEKGVKELMNAVVSIHDSHLKLMIIGSSNFKNARKTNYIRQLQNIMKGSNERIFLIGYVPNAQLYKYYQMADLQVVCSICEEAAGLVNIEGMMSGLPIIVTNSGGILEYIEENNCFVVDKYNSYYDRQDQRKFSEELAKAILYLKTHKSKLGELKENSAVKACNFTSNKFYSRFLKIVG